MADRRIDIIVGADWTGKAALEAARRDVEQSFAAYARGGQNGPQLAAGEARMAAAQADYREQSEKQLLAARMANWQKSSQAEWEASQRGVKADLDGYRQRVSLEDRLFNATHNTRQVALRDHEAYWSKVLATHRGNEKMLTLATRAEAAERARINEMYGGGGMGGALGMFGGSRRAAVRTARFAGANVMGIAGAGEIGYMASMALMPGMGWVAALSGAALLVVKGFTEASQASDKLVNAFSDLNKGNTEYYRSLHPLGGNTVQGHVFQKDVDEAKAELLKRQTVLNNRPSDYGKAWYDPESWTSLMPGNSRLYARMQKEADEWQGKLSQASKALDTQKGIYNKSLLRTADERLEDAKLAANVNQRERAIDELRLRYKRDLAEIDRQDLDAETKKGLKDRRQQLYTQESANMAAQWARESIQGAGKNAAYESRFMQYVPGEDTIAITAAATNRELMSHSGFLKRMDETLISVNAWIAQIAARGGMLIQQKVIGN